MVATRSSDTAKTARVSVDDGHYALQGLSRSPISGTNRKLVCDFLLAKSTNLYPILHRFQVTADYLSLTYSFGVNR